MIYWKYLKTTLIHKWFVLVAGLRLGGIPLWRLIVHDLSKFSPAEFGPSARFYWGKVAAEGADLERINAEYAAAWLHHENRNPHHWGYWIPRSGAQTGRPLPMPPTYVREMLADWSGAGRAYNGQWDMSEWVKDHIYSLPMNEDTFLLASGLLSEKFGIFVDAEKRKRLVSESKSSKIK